MTHHDPKAGPRPSDQLSDGYSHNFRPLAPFDVMKADSSAALLEQYKHASFGARGLGESADVLHAMVSDKSCFKVGTFSGAMTIAKMGLLIADMLDHGILDAVVSTGALMCHGLVEQTGHTHFKYDPSWSDEALYDAGYCRVYDTLELEANLDAADEIIQPVIAQFAGKAPFGSYEFNAAVGGYIREKFPGRGILQSAHQRGAPVYVPAFTDSELGLDVYTYNVNAKLDGRPGVQYDGLRDIADYADRCANAESLGIFTIGGGVPRNWAQQVGPLMELMGRRTKGRVTGSARFKYAVRICPEPVHWGGLSGCTYSEGVSWGKFIPREEGGMQAEAYVDATIGWPLVVRAVMERMGIV